jgi:hypothetical protein
MVERNVLLKGLQHPFLMGLQFSFQTTHQLYFVLEYVNGGDVLRKATPCGIEIDFLMERK